MSTVITPHTSLLTATECCVRKLRTSLRADVSSLKYPDPRPSLSIQRQYLGDQIRNSLPEVLFPLWFIILM